MGMGVKCLRVVTSCRINGAGGSGSWDLQVQDQRPLGINGAGSNACKGQYVE